MDSEFNGKAGYVTFKFEKLFAMGWDVTYEVNFQEPIEEWDADTVERAINRDLEDKYERIEFLYLRGQSSDESGGVCIVDLYAGACMGGKGIRDVMTVFWNLYGVSMKFRPYSMGNKPWIEFGASLPSTSDVDEESGLDYDADST